ncbi:hypothetical protein ACO1O0_005310 [Amphichorda felina]
MRHATLLGLVASVSAGHISVPLLREQFRHSNLHIKRDDNADTLTLKALNDISSGGYYSEFDIGTPPQRISFQLDTGSSDTWVNSDESDLCSDMEAQRATGLFCGETFDSEKSKTFELVDRNGFNITYLDTRNIQGDYFEDTVTIGDVKVKKQQLGLALKSVRPTGIMGLGFSSNVASEEKYKTIIDNMVDQGFIETPAFSLYLNDLSTDAGSILFGGIDAEKFIGDLATLPLLTENNITKEITSYNVAIEGFDVRSPKGEHTVDIPDLNSKAILDSGSTISLLPDKQVQELWDEFDVISLQELPVPLIDCAYAGDKGRGYIFEFLFANKTIQVPIDEMVIDAFGSLQDQLLSDRLFKGWEGVCMFGIGSTASFGINTDQFTLLGATFLRSAYVVYDMANKQVAIAQANLNSTDSNIVEITAGDLPKVTGVDESEGNDGIDDAAVGRMPPPVMAVAAVVGLLGVFMVAL